MEKLIPTNEIKYQKLEKNEENKIEEINTNLNNLSFFNKFFFIWAFKTIKYAYKKNNITVNDLNNLPSNYQSNSFYNKIFDIWENKQYKNIKKFPLLLTSIKANFSAIFIIFISTIFNCLINILSIYYFRLFVQQFITESSMKIKNLKIGLIYLSIRLIDLILQRKSTELLTNIGNKSAVELNCLVYNKLLKLSPSVEINSGKIINFIQNGGTVVIPVFSLGRSQEILYKLKLMQKEAKLSTNIPIFFDGKLAQQYTSLYVRGDLGIKEEMKDFLPENV